MAVRLFVYGVTIEAWTARYGVEPFSCPCAACGRMLTTTIPFVQGTLRGLQALPCECGVHDLSQRKDLPRDTVVCWPPYTMVRDPKHGDLFDGTLEG